MVIGRYLLTAAVLGLTAPLPVARADTLVDAIVQAYQSNPTLQSQRYDLKAVDEAYVRARAAIRPSAEFQFSGEYVDSRAGFATQALRLVADPTVGRRLESNRSDVRVVVEQLLYSGGQAASGIEAANYRVQAGREALRSVEGDLLLQVITAYADVLRDTESLEVRQQNLKTLERHLEMTRARQIAGEVTITDIAQAEAQLEGARTQLTFGQVQLQASRASYAALVGENAATLSPLPPLPLLPQDIDEAFERAEDSSPELLQAQFNERESLKRADAARASGSTVVSARASYGGTGELVPYYANNQDQAWTATLNVTKPLFTGGSVASGYREALNRNAADRLRIEATRRGMVQNIVLAWNNLSAAKRNLDVQARQLKAAELAAEGMGEEFRYGQRSTLDLLVAEQNLRDAQLSLINSRRDRYIAEANLLRHMGYLEARALIVGLEVYDPSEHLREVKEKGDVPWENLVMRSDQIGQGKARTIKLEAPQTQRTATMSNLVNETSADEWATQSPVIPQPGTMAGPTPKKEN